MNESQPPLRDDAGQLKQDGGLVSVSRRRFAKGAAPVLLGTLVSKPVLGAEYICTVSGNTSGNASAHLTDANCKVGKDVSYWLEQTTWPTGFKKGKVKSNCDPKNNPTLFNDFKASGTASLAKKFFVDKVNKTCVIGAAGNAASMYQVLANPSDDELAQLGRATVVSLLNAASVDAYPIGQARIIEMFNAVCDGSAYVVEGANLTLTALGVIEYLQKLYS